MKEYIEREKAQDGLDNIDWYHVNEKGQLLPGGKSDIETYVPFKAVEEMLKSIPAADVRPVVLCRDCTHCRKGKASLECEKHTYAWNNMNRWVDEDDFCSWGVRREES